MGHYIRPNDYVLSPEGPLLVTSAIPGDIHVELLNQTTSKTMKVTVAELRRNLGCGLWVRGRKNQRTGKVSNLSNSPCALERERFNREVVRRIEIEVRNGKSVAEAYRLHASDVVDLGDGKVKPMCSERQAQRLHKLSMTEPLGLTPAYAARGNRSARYSEDIRELVLWLTETQYAVPKSRITIRSLTAMVNECARESGLLKPEESVSRAYVKQTVIDFWNPDLDHKRLDARVARSAKAVARHRIRVGAPFHRVEQDTLDLPFIARSRLGVVEKISLMLAIDCATSVPLAWLLVPRAVTTEDTLQCLEIGMYSKAEAFKRFDITCDIDPYGAYLELHVDNGPENQGPRIDGVAGLGTDLTRTPVDSGHLKPFIERLNKSLKTALEGLPGCTRFDGKDGVRTEAAREDPLMTLEQLERWIVEWLFKKWINHPLERFITADYDLDKGLGITPAERWRKSEKHFPLPLPPDRDRWLELRYLEADCSMNLKTGITFETFKFRGDNLQTLVRQYGPRAKVKIRYNPSDYRCIYVADKHTGQYLALINSEVTPTTPAFSFGEAKQRRKAVRDTAVVPAESQEFDKNLTYASMLKKPKGRYAASREMSRATKTAEAYERAMEKPLPTPAASRSVASADTFVVSDAVPAFSIELKARQTPDTGEKK